MSGNVVLYNHRKEHPNTDGQKEIKLSVRAIRELDEIYGKGFHVTRKYMYQSVCGTIYRWEIGSRENTLERVKVTV